MLHRMEDRIWQLENIDNNQLSYSYNRDNREERTERGDFSNGSERGNFNFNEYRYKLKPVNYDGSVCENFSPNFV